MAGENVTLSYNQGKYQVKVTRIMYGPNIVSEEDQAQGGSATTGNFAAKGFYTRQVFLSTFALAVVFSTWEEREAFADWCVAYAKYVSNPMLDVGGIMRVVGPRNFDYIGVLVSGFDRTNDVHDLVYTMNLTFRGGQPTAANAGVSASTYTAPTTVDPANPYFYPDSTQLKAGDAAPVSLYDSPPPPANSSGSGSYGGGAGGIHPNPIKNFG